MIYCVLMILLVIIEKEKKHFPKLKSNVTVFFSKMQ